MTSKRQFRPKCQPEPALLWQTAAGTLPGLFSFKGVDAYEKSAFSFTMVAAKAWDIGGQKAGLARSREQVIKGWPCPGQTTNGFFAGDSL
jgi:hypothetical protein